MMSFRWVFKPKDHGPLVAFQTFEDLVKFVKENQQRASSIELQQFQTDKAIWTSVEAMSIEII